MDKNIISAGEFKTHCLKLMDFVHQKHTSLVITKRGKPLVQLTPYEDKIEEIWGCMSGRIVEKADITQSIDEKWSVDDL